jgi:hypothetical protein
MVHSVHHSAPEPIAKEKLLEEDRKGLCRSAAGRCADPPTQATLAARHDLAQFLRALYATLREIGTPDMQARMLPGLTAALKAPD